MSAYSVGAILGGFLAGLLVYRVLKQKQLSIGIWGIIPALIWALLWSAVLVPLSYTDDGTLIILIPVLGLIFGVLLSRLGIGLLCKKYSFSVTAKERKLVAISWAVCALMATVVAMAFVLLVS